MHASKQINITSSDSIKLTWWQRIFGFDSRSLSLFRVALGLLVAFDALTRWPILREFYSDDGMFTRSLMESYFNRRYDANYFANGWSLHALSGELSWQQTLFISQMIAGIAISIGCWTRIATIAGWVLVASHQFRSPLIITSGDYILKLMLFWSMFLPLSLHGSVDRSFLFRRPARQPNQQLPAIVFHWGSIAFLMQFILMYFFTGIAKWNDIWFSGEAMSYVFNLDIYLRPLAKKLLGQESFLKIVTWATLFFEVVGIWFLLIPKWNSFWRLSLLTVYWCFHLGIALTMNIGLFPLICMAVWLPLIPSLVWRRSSSGEVADLPPWLVNGWRFWVQQIANYACGAILALALVWNLANIESINWTRRLPKSVVWVGEKVQIDQHFQMFGHPPDFNPWFVYEGRLKNGSKVDLFFPSHELNYAEPRNAAGRFPNHFWRKFHRNLTIKDFDQFRKPLLDFVVVDWNANHSPAEQVVSAKLICSLKRIGPDVDSANIVTEIWGTWGNPNESAGSLFDDLDEKLNSDSGIPF